MLSVLGGFLGLGLSVWGQQILLSLVSGAGKTVSVDVRPDLRVLLFSAAISLVTGLLFGAAPALHAIRENVDETLKGAASGTPFGRSGLGLKGGLVGVQVALSMVLLILGGLFVHTLPNLKYQDLGLRAANLLSVQLGTQGQYRPAWPTLTTKLLRRVEAVPGVRSACTSFDGALGNAGGIRGFRFDESSTPAGVESRAGANWVSPRYFETLGIPLLEGREFSARDTAGSPLVAIVNRTMARRYAGTEHATGRRFLFNRKSYEIVGVAKDAKRGDLRKSTGAFVYFAALQNDSAIHSLEVRTTVAASAVAGDLRHIVREFDPRLRVAGTATAEQLIDQKLAREVLVADLAGFFAGLTLVLVVIGVYGTVAYSVARRTKEIAIRITLGARPANIRHVVLRRLMFAIVTGLVAGTAFAIPVARMLAFLLFGLKATDVQTIGEAGLILCVASLVAAYLPVRRALRLAPTTALRLE